MAGIGSASFLVIEHWDVVAMVLMAGLALLAIALFSVGAVQLWRDIR